MAFSSSVTFLLHGVLWSFLKYCTSAKVRPVQTLPMSAVQGKRAGPALPVLLCTAGACRASVLPIAWVLGRSGRLHRERGSLSPVHLKAGAVNPPDAAGKLRVSFYLLS